MVTDIIAGPDEMIQYIGESGRPVGELPEFADDRDILVIQYRDMVLARTFDEKAIALQRTGRLGTYASCLGQEAIGVGLARAMSDDDVLLPSFREHGAQLVRGVRLTELFQYWGGDERGNAFSAAVHDFPVSIPVASHFPHAAGVALAKAVRKETGVAVAVGGDGATSKGEFYEALNLIGVWKLPAVIVVNNNQWAISVPRSEQTASRTLAEKAAAAGLPGERVDGNDIVAVHDAALRAIRRARDGHGPTLVECVSYRLSDHTTADDASRYREEAEVSEHWKKEPVRRMRVFLTAEHSWSAEDEEQLLRQCRAEVEAAAEEYLALPAEPVSAIFDHLYADIPDDIARQLHEVADA